MATRCTCAWTSVQIHPDVEPLLLRESDEPGCPASTVHGTADS